MKIQFSEISVLAASLTFITVDATAQDTNTQTQLPQLVIESDLFDGRTPDEFAQSIELISGEELDRNLSNSIGETVKNELGVNSTYFAPGASRPIIRGLGSNRVRVLENGIDSLDVSSVSEDHPVSIEPYFAKQIEIIRGPATLRYGPGAIGGIVNVVNDRIPQTLETDPFELKAAVEHATVSSGETAALEINGAHNSFAWHLDGLIRSTEDYEINGFANEEEPENRGQLGNSDIETDNQGIGGSYITDAGLIGLAFSRFNTDFGVPGAEEGDIRLDASQSRLDFHGELFHPINGIDKITLRSTFNDYEHDEVEEEGDIATTFDNEEIETRLELINSVNDQWKNAFGLQFNDREFSAVGEEAFVQPVDETRIGLFAISRYNADTLDLEGGVRFDRDEFEPESGEDVDFNVFSISLGAQRKITDSLKFNVSAARSERAPQEVALFADGPHLATLTFETGSTDIEEEKSFNIEFGLQQSTSNYSWSVSAFYNRIDDYIYLASVDDNNDGIADRADEEGEFELDGELLVGVYENEDADFFGIEAEFVRNIIDNKNTNLQGRIFADLVRAEFRDGGVGNVPRIPPARLGLGVNGKRNSWVGSVDLIFVADQNNEAELETETDGYTQLNASLSKTFFAGNTDLKLFIKGENLLDEDARQHSSFTTDRVVLPGRGFTLGLSLEL